ncbi:glycosyltransferase family 39 protein [Lacibacter sp. H375]|uniref:ArnT family glycosyltransferase n=1 Tax=Lacibacter sp. H375 TaxID=3133424 RepID=UPI0030C32E3E
MNTSLFSKYRSALTIAVIILVSILMHWSVFQKDLIGIHVWRQSQTQLNISNFYRVDNNILHPRVNILDTAGEPQILRTDFPLMQWTVAQLYHVFGESIVVTRICMFLLGIISITGFFLLVYALFKQFHVAAIAAWSFSFSPVFYYYTLNPIPDNLALCFAIWSMYYFIKYRNSNRFLFVILSATCVGFATLIKLPYILFAGIYAHAFLSSILATRAKNPSPISKKISFALPYLLLMIPAATWYYTVIPEWGENPVLKGNFNYSGQSNRISEILQYHYTTMLPQLLLNYAGLILLFCGVIAIVVKRYYKKQLFWQIASGFLLVVLYFVYEFFPIDIIHDYYLMPFLPFLYLLIAAGINFLFSYTRLANYIITAIAVLMPVLTYGTVQENWTVERSYINDNIIIHQQELKQAIPVEARCIFMNDVSLHIWPYLLDKKGYVFNNDQLPKEWIDDMIRTKNVRYIYSDSRIIDENPGYQYLFDSVLLQKGTVKLIKLKQANQIVSAQ